MSQNDFEKLLVRNKKDVANAIKQFEKHSKNFDDRLRKIMSLL